MITLTRGWARPAWGAPSTATSVRAVSRVRPRPQIGSGLKPPQLRIASVSRYELVVGAGLDNPAGMKDVDAVGQPHRGEPVRDEQHGPAIHDLADLLEEQ